MASSNLDDLLKSIRDEAKKESALVAVEAASDDRLVDEEIDERVLRLLGIEDVFDIDYATYKTLLKERMVAARMANSKIPTEEAEVITNEFKRVKGKEGRFKVKKKKISVGDIRKTSPLKGLGAVQEDSQKLLAPAKEVGPIDQIINSLANIVNLLRERNSLLKKQANIARKNRQNKARGDAEAKAEAGMFGKVLEGAKKVIAPVTNLLGRIIETFMKIIFGRFLIKFIDWFSDPENQKKINAIGRFLKDHWPKLLLAYLLFGNSLGRFVTRITVMLVRGAATLVTKVLPSLLKFVKANPLLGKLAIPAVLFGAGAAVPAMFPGTTEDKADKQANKAAEEKGADQAAADIRNQKGGMFDFLTGAGQERREQAQRLETGEEKRYGFFGELAGGGQVSGPSGTDVVPARLTDGEFVMSKDAVDAFGTDFMESINAAGGGNNRPKMSSGTVYADGGGQIGRGSGHGSPEGGYDTGSLLNNPLGALDRILGQSSGGRFRLPGRGPDSSKPDSRPEPKSDPQPKPPQSKPPKSKPESKPKEPLIPGKADPPPPEEPGIPEKMLKSPTFRDSGLLYLRHLMGGLGGAITEQDLSRETKHELNLAIARAKKRHAGNLAKATREWEEAKKGGWNKSSSQEGRDAYATRKSQYERLKSGQIQVLYQDYYDGNDEKNITKSAEDSKSVLGQFWAQQTEDGGYRIVNEKYDFQPMNDPYAVLMGDSRGIAKDAKDGKPDQEITLRNKLQALAQLNPFTKDMTVDMILGQPETAERQTNNILRKMGGFLDFVMRDTTDFDGQGIVASSEAKGEKGVPFPTRPETLLPKNTQEKLDAKPKLTAQQIKNNQAYAASKGKYYSSTTGKTYASYADALKDPAVAAGAAATAKPTYNPLDPKNMTSAQKTKLNVEPPPQRTAEQIVNQYLFGQDELPTAAPKSNSLPNISASSGSTSSNRFLQTLGIQ